MRYITSDNVLDSLALSSLRIWQYKYKAEELLQLLESNNSNLALISLPNISAYHLFNQCASLSGHYLPRYSGFCC
jgi:hypothetical protein